MGVTLSDRQKKARGKSVTAQVIFKTGGIHAFMIVDDAMNGMTCFAKPFLSIRSWDVCIIV